MNKKISVIVPVYNAQETIEKCINSILLQTYTNLEVIIVNDGSQDKSDEICKKIASTDKRIKYYSKNNTGVSDTRNFGLKESTGDYIAFVDSDDFLDKDMYEVMINEIQDSDILICNYSLFNKEYQKIEKKTFFNNSSYSSLSEMIKNIDSNDMNRYFNPPWNKLINRNLINKNLIIFDNNLSLGEDLIFNLTVMKEAKRIKTINKKLYNYMLTLNGLNQKKRNLDKYMNNSIYLINELLKISQQVEGVDNILINEIRNILLTMTNNYEEKDFDKFLQNISEKVIDTINYKNLNIKNKFVSILLRYRKYKEIFGIYLIKKVVKGRNI